MHDVAHYFKSFGFVQNCCPCRASTLSLPLQRTPTCRSIPSTTLSSRPPGRLRRLSRRSRVSRERLPLPGQPRPARSLRLSPSPAAVPAPAFRPRLRTSRRPGRSLRAARLLWWPLLLRRSQTSSRQQAGPADPLRPGKPPQHPPTAPGAHAGASRPNSFAMSSTDTRQLVLPYARCNLTELSPTSLRAGTKASRPRPPASFTLLPRRQRPRRLRRSLRLSLLGLSSTLRCGTSTTLCTRAGEKRGLCTSKAISSDTFDYLP